MLVQQGLEVSTEELIITNGSEQALSLAMRYYIQSGDWVIVETPTYHGALGILKNLEAKVIGIPMTAEGMNLELLEQYLCSHRPKLIYTISALHNPTGITTSQAITNNYWRLPNSTSVPFWKITPIKDRILNLCQPQSKLWIGTIRLLTSVLSLKICQTVYLCRRFAGMP